MGVSAGSLANMILTLYGKPIHNAVATSAGLGVPITIAGTIGYMLAGLPRQALMPPFSIGFVSLVGLVLMAPISAFVAPYGARLAHALSRKQLEIAFGIFLLLIARAFPSAWFGEVPPHRSRAHRQSVAAHLPALQPVEETHAEQVGAQRPGCAISAGTDTLGDAPDRDAIERHRRRARAAVRGLDVDGVGEHFERQAGCLRGILGEHHGGRAGIEHHREARAVDLRRHLEVPAAAARDFDRKPARHRPSRDQLGEHALANLAQRPR